VEVLSAISEFPIGLAGFSGVAAAIMQRSSAVSELDRIRIVYNIWSSLIPGFIAFLTLAMINSETKNATVFRFGSGAIVVFILALLILLPIIRRKAGGLQRFNPVVLGLSTIVATIDLPLQSYNWVVVPDTASGILIAALSRAPMVGAATFAGMLWQMLGYDSPQPSGRETQ
jgi:hypothetical protein